MVEGYIHHYTYIRLGLVLASSVTEFSECSLVESVLTNLVSIVCYEITEILVSVGAINRRILGVPPLD